MELNLFQEKLKNTENLLSFQPRYSRKRSKSVATSVSVTAEVFNVLVSFKSTQCNVGDESQIIMNVYDSRDQKFIRYDINKEKLRRYQQCRQKSLSQKTGKTMAN